MYASSGAAYLASAAIAKAAVRAATAVAVRAVPALAAYPWVAVALTVLATIASGRANEEFIDKVRLVLRYSMWGKYRGDPPHKNEAALGPWWLLLDNDDIVI